MQAYVDRVVQEILAAPELAAKFALDLPGSADTVYLGGGTPSLLRPQQLASIFAALRQRFHIGPEAEITMEAAPGQIEERLLDTALACGLNRVSLGVQSFVDREARAVGRLHTGQACIEEMERLRAAGVPRLSVDLIAGLPLQTASTWQHSLDCVASAPLDHVSVYMLETDGDSRLGTEVERFRAASQLSVLGQQARYHADTVPSEEVCTELYHQACASLQSSGFAQYEISNFARTGGESRHNRKYWERAPYLGFGLDAHSMLFRTGGDPLRFQNADELDTYLAAEVPSQTTSVTREEAFEEAVFLGLRLTEGVRLAALAPMAEPAFLRALTDRARDLAAEGLLTISADRLALTARGRVLSSSVFGELLTVAA